MDFPEVTNFLLKVKDFGKATEIQAKAGQAKLTLQVLTGVIWGNPVDTGTMRGGWVASVGVPSSYVPETLNDRAPSGTAGTAGQANIDAAAKSIFEELKSAPIGTPTFVSDNVRYAGKVNAIHPTKAGFVEAVLENVKGQFSTGAVEVS